MNISDNTLAASRQYFEKKLSSYYPKTEIDSFFWMALEHYFEIEKKDYFSEPNKRLSESELLLLRSCIKELQEERPIQYILGFTEFYGLKLQVNSSVLIPRPETEELVEYVINTLGDSTSGMKIIDIGTGSGCIPIAIKKNIPLAEVYALDVSQEALKLAKMNAESLDVKIDFIHSDVLSDDFPLKAPIECIVSNPPYVRKSESDKMKNNVVKYEPHLALFVEDEDPLIFHRRIGEIGMERLCKGGHLFFEINEEFGTELTDLLKEQGYERVDVKKDLSGRNRMIRAIK